MIKFEFLGLKKEKEKELISFFSNKILKMIFLFIKIIL